ncbi:MAG: rhodanese-like domain-containing protein [Candidatus Dadabacteria bacterium]|nr:rhodanese-like domain-containing protein [Candidatus Dadabacteria bacterium]NIQ15491.1 rhodanese-like domain-containing protein [Candidatus Dadabacteria bacterium]
MRKIKLLIISICVVIGLSAIFYFLKNNLGVFISKSNDIQNSSQIYNYGKIATELGYELLEINSNNPGFIVLDVRTPSEFAEGHVKEATNIDYLSPNFKNELKKLNKNKTFLVYCRSGRKSSKTFEILKELEFKKVYDMGGILDWKQKGYPIVK